MTANEIIKSQNQLSSLRYQINVLADTINGKTTKEKIESVLNEILNADLIECTPSAVKVVKILI